MSYKPPYGPNLSLRYTVSYNPPAGGTITVSISSQENINGFFDPFGIAPVGFGTAVAKSRWPVIKVSGIAPLNSGQPSIKNKARLLIVQAPFPGGFGRTVASNVRKLLPTGIAPSGVGNLFGIVLGYYTPPFGQNLPISYRGSFLPIVGRGIPIDYKNTHVFRQIAGYGIVPVGFGSTHIRNTSQSISLAYEGIAPALPYPSTTGVYNKLQFIKVHSLLTTSPSTQADFYNYRIIIAAKGYPFESFGTLGIVNKNKVVKPLGFGSDLYFSRPKIYNRVQYITVSGDASYSPGATNISYRIRTIRPGLFLAAGVGPKTNVQGTYKYVAPKHDILLTAITEERIGTPGIGYKTKPIHPPGLAATLWGTAQLQNMALGPCSITWDSHQVGEPNVAGTRYIYVPEVEPKFYSNPGPPLVLADGCGASFVGNAKMNLQYINLDSAKDTSYIVDYVNELYRQPDFFGSPVLTHKVRSIDMSSYYAAPFEAVGKLTATNFNRQIFPAGLGSPYFGIPVIPGGHAIMPYWGWIVPVETPDFAIPTDAYGMPMVGFAVPTGPYTQTISPVGFSTIFGNTLIQLFNRRALMGGWDSSSFYHIAVAPPYPAHINGFVDEQFGTAWASFRVRYPVMQGFADEQIGVGFSGADGVTLAPMKVRLAYKKIYPEGIEPYEPLIGFSCSRWTTTQTKVAHRPKQLPIVGFEDDKFGTPGVIR